MKKWSRVAVTSAVALALASPAFAQSADTDPMAKPSAESPAAGSSSTVAPAAEAPAVTTDGDVIVAQESGQTLSSDLIGMKVMGTSDESIGSVSDLIIADGRVVGAVLDVGGFLGLGAKQIGVPWDAMNVTRHDGSTLATLPLTKEQLTSMPEFKTLADIEAEQDRKAATSATGTGAGSATGTVGSGTPKQ
ncbi:MAG: PRC-barrel domain-containing protein [Thalassobaculum sp.]|uniref:PRC-barrel domain-containing protein n=1 Tax=Thalassobaculum sp. TaxID=2022740 RepID=UPI0032F04622